jgi:hypothetical protein
VGIGEKKKYICENTTWNSKHKLRDGVRGGRERRENEGGREEEKE